MRSCNGFLLFNALFLVILVLLVFVYLSRCLLRVERIQFERSKDEEFQGEVLKTLSSYYLILRQVYSLIIFHPNNIYFMLACIKLIGHLFIPIVIRLIK